MIELSETEWESMDEMDMIISLHKMLLADKKYLSTMEAYQQMVTEIESLKGKQVVSDVRTARGKKHNEYLADETRKVNDKVNSWVDFMTPSTQRMARSKLNDTE
jgi:hypothetical protein